MIRHLSAIEVELASVAEAGDDAMVHLASCDACRARVEALQASNEAFASDRPFHRFEATLGVDHEVPRTLFGVVRRGLVLGALAAAAGLVFFVGPAPEVIRTKGREAHLEVVRERSGTQSRHRGKVLIRLGDRLRFAVRLRHRAALQLFLLEGEDAPVLIHDAGTLDVGEYYLPNTALRAQPPLVEARVRLVLDGEPAAHADLIPDHD